ncbi:MAG: HypC/HybG/HupF family hydrogenase formation chaperone [Bacteroidota bacterium]
MCLAIPGQVVTIENISGEVGSSPLMGTVDFSGIRKSVCLDWVSDVKIGEYVIVHVGFAISKVDEEEARETLKLFEQIAGSLDELKYSGTEKNDLQ